MTWNYETIYRVTRVWFGQGNKHKDKDKHKDKYKDKHKDKDKYKDYGRARKSSIHRSSVSENDEGLFSQRVLRV